MIYETDVQSSAIKHIKYDKASKILKITFKNDATYDYYEVPYDEVKNLAAAESVGRYFNAHIKKYSINA